MGKIMENTYVVIPGCCDLNRGDQALGWETARIAQDAGFKGKYDVLAERDEPVQQSIDEGYKILTPVLEHPSRKFSSRNNITYGVKLKLLWGSVAIKDLVVSLIILSRILRPIYLFFSRNNSTRSETVREIMNSKAVFMKGGGLIQSHGGIVSTYATYYRLYHIFLAHSLKKPVYILPNSFGPFEGPFVKFMVKKAFSDCRLVTAREDKTKQAVKDELGLNINVFPDLAFYLPNGKVSKSKLFNKLDIPMHKKVVAITMRPYRFPDAANPEKAYEQFKHEMRGFIRKINVKGYVPLIIEHTFAVTAHESDGNCIQDVISGMDVSEYRLLSDRSMNCRELKAVYGMCDYIVGTRFHSLIFSLSNKVPGIAISYDGYKSVGIMTDMGLSDFVLDISQVSSDRLISLFDKMIDQETESKAKIQDYIQMASVQRDNLIKALREAD